MANCCPKVPLNRTALAYISSRLKNVIRLLKTRLEPSHILAIDMKMRFEFSKTQLKRYQKIAHIVSIFCFLIGLAFILVVSNDLGGFSGYITKIGMILAYATFILFLFDKLHIKPYKNTEKYFFEINEDNCIFSHPENKSNFLPEQYQFKINDIKSMKFREVEGLEELYLTINDPKRMGYILKIWGFENIRQILNELQMLLNIRDRNNPNS